MLVLRLDISLYGLVDILVYSWTNFCLKGMSGFGTKTSHVFFPDRDLNIYEMKHTGTIVKRLWNKLFHVSPVWLVDIFLKRWSPFAMQKAIVLQEIVCCC